MLDLRTALQGEHRRELLAEAERERLIKLARGQSGRRWANKWVGAWVRAIKKRLTSDTVFAYLSDKRQME